MIDDDCGAVGGMNDTQANQSTRRKLAPVLFWPPQILMSNLDHYGGKPATDHLNYKKYS
jgi:hypothetical protein